MDLSAMNLQELKRLQRDVERAIASYEQRQIAAARAELEAHARELGFALSLDDFGTGYSSLSYLRSLPLSEIKLDQSFVRDLHTTEVSRRLSEAVMSLGQSLKLTVLAEGVENMAQYRLLKQQNCHVAQGYLLSRPLPPKELENWITNWRPRDMADQHALL